jgi:nucleoside-diphosphate-sugar epimerase
MKLIITGAIDMVGSDVVRQAIADEEIDFVTAIVRRQVRLFSIKTCFKITSLICTSSACCG